MPGSVIGRPPLLHRLIHRLIHRLLHRHQSAEVVPLEEDVHLAEAVPRQQLPVLLQPVGDEDVFERLALLGDLQVRVPVPLLQLVVVLDEQAVERAALAEDLLDEDQATFVGETAADPFDEPVAIERADELQRQDEQHGRGVLDLHLVVEVGLDQLVGERELALGELLAGEIQHLLRRVDADEADVGTLGQEPGDLHGGRARRAAEIVDRRARSGEVGGELRDHPLDLGVERYRTVQHVVEDPGGLGAEIEVRDRARLGEDPVFRRSGGSSFGTGLFFGLHSVRSSSSGSVSWRRRQARNTAWKICRIAATEKGFGGTRVSARSISSSRFWSRLCRPWRRLRRAISRTTSPRARSKARIQPSKRSISARNWPSSASWRRESTGRTGGSSMKGVTLNYRDRGRCRYLRGRKIRNPSRAQ